MPNYGNAAPGNPVPAFSLDLTDDALVVIDFAHIDQATGKTGFIDTGFMPVNPSTIAGLPLHLPAWADGLVIEYTADGTQQFDSTGHPTTATYSHLTYSLVAYKGNATFGHDPITGALTTTGVLKEAVVAQGILGSSGGALGFTPSGDIKGSVDTLLQIGNRTVGTLDLSVFHNGKTDVAFASSGMTLSNGTIRGTFTPIALANS